MLYFDHLIYYHYSDSDFHFFLGIAKQNMENLAMHESNMYKLNCQHLEEGEIPQSSNTVTISDQHQTMDFYKEMENDTCISLFETISEDGIGASVNGGADACKEIEGDTCISLFEDAISEDGIGASGSACKNGDVGASMNIDASMDVGVGVDADAGTLEDIGVGVGAVLKDQSIQGVPKDPRTQPRKNSSILEPRDAIIETVFQMVANLERRLRIIEDYNNIINNSNNMKEENKSSRIITKEQMKNMVFEAVTSGNPRYGVGKSYIRNFLMDRFEVPMTLHYAKKITMTLQAGLAEDLLAYDPVHHLYKTKNVCVA